MICKTKNNKFLRQLKFSKNYKMRPIKKNMPMSSQYRITTKNNIKTMIVTKNLLAKIIIRTISNLMKILINSHMMISNQMMNIKIM